jgi:hypothetical protein
MPSEQRPPYRAYATILGTYTTAVLGAAGLARATKRDPACNTPLDLVLLTLASFKAARTLSRDPVTAPLRAPFIEGEATGENEEPVQTGGMQQAIGELVTCSRCVGTWSASGLVWTQVLLPRFGRMLTWSLAAAGANDFLQAGFTALGHKSNELAERDAES